MAPRDIRSPLRRRLRAAGPRGTLAPCRASRRRRGHLKKADDTFRDLAAEPLAERAAAELRASGETARRRDPSTLVQLTPTELRIAQLVSEGMKQQEAAEAC